MVVYLEVAGKPHHADVIGEVQDSTAGLRLLHAGSQHAVPALDEAHRVMTHGAV